MSSSGLIYAVIVGAWAAYLVPMWLRRQDELNEARPTERFSTAIRLLSGRAAMERRYARSLDGGNGAGDAPTGERPPAATDLPEAADPAPAQTVDVRALAVPATEVKPLPKPRPAAVGNKSRAKVLAARRRTTTLLFLAFTAGAVVAAVGGLAFLWAPGVPAALLTLYIGHLRRQERRRFEFTMDQRRATEAATRLRERPSSARRRPAPTCPQTVTDIEPEPAAAPEPPPSPRTADRRALVEQTDHAEWVDQQREQNAAAADDGWEPVPVPLPTYVTAPVAPRTAGGGGPDIPPDPWSSARSSSAAAEPEPEPRRELPRPGGASRRPADRARTPLFDQYADETRPRAANE